MFSWSHLRPNTAIPCIFPASREFGFRDEFAQDCLLQGRVCKPSVPSRICLLSERKRQFSQPPLDPIRFDVSEVLAVHARWRVFDLSGVARFGATADGSLLGP